MDIAVIIFVSLAFLAGLLGTVLPVIPGTGLIFLGILAYVWHFGIATIGMGTLITLGIATALSFLFDYLGSAYGAKRFGASAWGVTGSIVGGFLGMLLLNVPGLIFGVFFGAAFAEMLFAGKGAEQSFRAGLGSVIGFLGGTVIKFIVGLTMIVIFLAKAAF